MLGAGYFAARARLGRVKQEAPDCLVTYANFPTTEYLRPREIDFVCFNVYLHQEQVFRNYLARLQNIAGDKPLGTMGSSADGMGLALIRIDRAADALDAGTPLTAGGIAIRLAEPDNVRSAPKKTVA